MYLIGAVVLLRAALAVSPHPGGAGGAGGARSVPDPGPGAIAVSAALSQPLMHARALVQLPGLPRLFRAPFEPLLTGFPRPEQARAFLQQTAPFWPEQLVVDLPRSAFASVDSMVRTFMLGALVEGARQGGVSARKDLSVLRAALASQLRKVQLPGLRVSARFSDATTGLAVWRMLDELTGALAAQGLKVSRTRESVTLRFRLGQLLDAKDLTAMVVDMGWAAGKRDSQTKAITTAIRGIEVQASMVLTGAAIEVTLGPHTGAPGDAEGMPAAPVAIAGDQLVATARWDLAPLRTMVTGWRELWAKWEGTAAGKRTRADDDQDLLGDIAQLSRALDTAGDGGEAWLWVDRGVHAIMREHGTAPLTPLGSDPIGALLPADLVALDLGAGRNLGQLLSNGLDRVENRLAYRSLRQPGDDPGRPSEAEQKESAFYKTFAELRQLIHMRGHTFFSGASAVVMGPGTHIGRADLRLNGRPPAVLKDIAVPEVAVFGRAQDSQAALGFVADAWTAVGKAIAGRLGGADVAPRLTEAPPLIAGATVRWLDSAWLEQTTGETVTFDGGFKPHVALLNDILVLSTSPGLTQKILSLRSATASGRRALPSTQAPLVGWTRIPCAPFARQTGDGLAAIEKMFGALNFGTAAQPRSPTTIGQLFNLACGVVADVTELGTQQGGEKTTRYDATAAPGLYRQ